MKIAQTSQQPPRPAPMAVLYALAGIIEDRRDENWELTLLNNAWQAVFLIPGLDEGTAVCSLGGFPYLRLAMPRAGLDYTGYSLSDVALLCLEKGVGAAIFMTEADAISDSFARISLGDIDILYRQDIADATNLYQDKSEVIRSYTARALQRQIKGLFPSSTPKVRIALGSNSSADVALSLGLDLGRLTTEMTEPLFSALEWCLPRGITYRLLDITAENEETAPLAAFF